MTQHTQEWVDKAEDDFEIAGLLLEPEHSRFDASCFHSQQAAEKYRKAHLIEVGVAFPKIHDLEALLLLVLPSLPDLVSLQPRFQSLSGHAIEFRYPGRSADEIDANDALETARLVRDAVRTSLTI